MSALVVWLVRHGATAAPPGLALGWTDPPLSPRGERQAAGAAGRLVGRPLAAVHSSDLRRARRTAELVASPHRLAVAATPELRELSFGAWEGRPLSELWTECPAAAAAWAADLRRTPAGFGESLADLERRVARFAAALVAGGAGEVAVVAHQGSLAALRAALCGGGFAAAWASRLALGEVARVEVEAC